VKAKELIDNLNMAEIILGDTNALKSVAQELKTRGIKPTLRQDGENRFILTILRTRAREIT